MPIVFIRKQATGEIRRHVDEYPWQGDYIWSEGNYACDCNRHLFFERAAGHEPYDDEDYEGKCGDEAYVIRIDDENGNELYRDESWQCEDGVS
jgi:hypothetical protein